MRRSSRTPRAPSIITFRASQSSVRNHRVQQNVQLENQTEDEPIVPYVIESAIDDIIFTQQAPEQDQTSSQAAQEDEPGRTVSQQIASQDQVEQLDTALSGVESVINDTTTAPEVLERTDRSNKRICHELPDRVLAIIYLMGVGRTSNKVSETMNLYISWPCEYLELQALLAEQVATRSERLPGAWDAVRHVCLQGLTSKKTPTGCNEQFSNEEHWRLVSDQYETLVKSTGKFQRIAFKYTYKAKASTPPSSQIRPSQSTFLLQRHIRPQFASPSPSASVDSENDGNLTPPPTITPRPRVRETTTTRRENELTPEQWKKSQIEQEIRQSHKCGTCSQGYCFKPIHSKRHCQIHNKSLAEWVNAVYNKIGLTSRPPATCPEYKAWIAETDSASSTARPGNTAVESSHAPPTIINYNYYGQASGIKADEAESHTNPPIIDLPSSPLTTMIDEAMEEYELFANWLHYTIDKHKELTGVDCISIRDKLQEEHLGIRYVKNKLRENNIAAWTELKAFGITRGVALCLYKEFSSWKDCMRESYHGFEH